MSTRNYEEYRAQALAELGEDYTVEDLRNEEKFRKKVLDGLGAEYTDEDTHNFERYRLKVLENLSGGGGGGGGGDFTTANVTIINNHTRISVALGTANCVENDEILNFPYISGALPSVAAGTTKTLKCVLYKGTCVIRGNNYISDISGAITYDETNHVYIITGDCTITIS